MHPYPKVLKNYSNNQTAWCKLLIKKKLKRCNSPLHLLVVLSKMALVDTILPYLGGQKTGSMTEVTMGQQEDCAAAIGISILAHFLRLHGYGCKHEYATLNQLCQSSVKCCLPPPFCLCLLVEAVTVTLLPGLVFSTDRRLNPRAKNNLFQACLYHTHTHTQANTQTHTSLLNAALLSGIFGSNRALKCCQ